MVSKATRVKAELRRTQILEMVKAGMTERQIAKVVGVSAPMVHKDIKKALFEHAKRFSDTAESVRPIQMDRLNALLSVHWPDAMDGDPDAFDRVLRVMGHINQINGLTQSVNVYDQRNQLQINNNAPVTFRIIDDNSNNDRLSPSLPLPEAEGRDI